MLDDTKVELEEIFKQKEIIEKKLKEILFYLKHNEINYIQSFFCKGFETDFLSKYTIQYTSF